MTVVIPVCSHDAELCRKNLGWSLELEGGKAISLKCILLIENGTDDTGIEDLANKLFTDVAVHRYDQWKGSQAWPQPQNYAWQAAARLMQKGKDTWFWWEQDVTPLKGGWLTTLAEQHARCGKPFMGHVVPNLVPGGHMNGAAFYPADVAKYSINSFLAHDVPFDVVMASAIRNQWHEANHVMGHFVKGKDRRGVHFVDRRNYDSFFGSRSTLLCFHGCNDGSLIDVLRDTMPSPVSVTREIQKVFSGPTKPLKKLWNWVVKREPPMIYHCVERHTSSSPEAERRVRYAFDSWCALYQTGHVKAAHLWDHDYKRDASELGDHRRLPFLKDVLMIGMNQCKQDDDMVMMTNDDTVIRTSILPVLLEYMSNNEAITSFRLNFDKGNMPSFAEPGPVEFAPVEHGKADIGRDLFCFRKRWLSDHWAQIPDFLLGECPWDLVLAALVRLTCDPPVTFNESNQDIVMEPCELSRGYVLHERHYRNWIVPANGGSPGQKWNKELANQWASEWNLPVLRQGMHERVQL